MMSCPLEIKFTILEYYTLCEGWFQVRSHRFTLDIHGIWSFIFHQKMIKKFGNYIDEMH